jgi:hypothetical protein
MGASSGHISYFARNAPLAILTSSLPGLVNYVIILFLTAHHSLEHVGEYRLLISYLGLVGLASFPETSKIQVRARALGDARASAVLFFTRCYGIGLVTMTLWCVHALELATGSAILPAGLLGVATVACLALPAELFLSHLQAERRFALLAGISAVKYLSSLAVFVTLALGGYSIQVAVMAQITTMAAFNVAFFATWLGPAVAVNARAVWSPAALARDRRAQEAITLSVANWLPGSLEHLDKMVIGYLFGLQALGLYTLAFSTGRFLYNSLKPAFYIYYRQFVDKLPGRRLLQRVTVAFTLLGAALLAAFLAAVYHVPAFAAFEGGEAVVGILFMSYGIAMADAVYTQSYGINRDAKARHLLVANLIISVACLVLFSMSAFVSLAWAQILCALHYPLRHAGTLFALSRLRRRDEQRAP